MNILPIPTAMSEYSKWFTRLSQACSYSVLPMLNIRLSFVASEKSAVGQKVKKGATQYMLYTMISSHTVTLKFCAKLNLHIKHVNDKRRQFLSLHVRS